MSSPSSLLANPKLLLVDDEVPLREVYATLLRTAGYRVLEAGDGATALQVAQEQSPSLVLLDVDMPRMNGWQTLEQLRKRDDKIPVIMLTGLGDVSHRVKGLGAGADDYLGKPCDPRELMARVHALLRRTQVAASVTHVLYFGGIAVDLEKRTVTAPGEPPALTKTEFAMLELLSRQPGQPVSRDTILDSVWGYTHRPATRTVETHIWRLRGKLGDDGPEARWLRTVHGFGYALFPDPAPAVVAEASV